MIFTRGIARKVTIVTVVVVFLWFIYAFTSLIEVPKNSFSSKSVDEFEERILKLEKRINNELLESGKLLDDIKEELSRIDQYAKDNALDHRPILPVLVIACDRITVQRCIENLIKYRPDKKTFPIIISQDCGHNATYEKIKFYTDRDPSVSVVRQPDLSEIPLQKQMVKFKGYYKIARHFKFALNHVLVTLGHEAVIVVEDDLDISPDFFEYFLGTYPLLHKDKSIWCISAWNDNGKKGLIDTNRTDLLHRTDFFPGLGWMMTRESWLGLEPHWPPAFFDDWLRDPVNTHGRSCIRPEISRTYSFGKVGVSKGLFFDLHLRYIQLNLDPVDFTKLDLNYLLKENYDKNLQHTIDSIPVLTSEEVMSAAFWNKKGPVKVLYSNAKSFQRHAKKLGLMEDFRSGIPRTAYRGVVSCTIRGRRVYLVPDFKWVNYDPKWS